MNSNSNLISLSFSDARRRALVVISYPWVTLACDIPCWMFLCAMELRVRDENSLSISWYTAAILGLRQGTCKVEMLAI